MLQPKKTKAKPKAAPKATKAKAPAKTKAAPKKLTQTTLTSKAATKKRPKPESDEDNSDLDVSGLSNTPPSAKKQKKSASASKKSSGKPLNEIENDSMQLDSPEPPRPAAGSKKSAEETYQKLTHLQHIIKRPDTYIGSVEMTEAQMWTFNNESKQMELRKVHYVPGLYKIFDEILVNAADNKQRDSSEHGVMTALKVNIDRSKGEISVENNGKGIPVLIHAVSFSFVAWREVATMATY